MTRIIQDLTPAEIDHIIVDAPKRCYSEIAHELDVGVNTVKRVVRNYNNSLQVEPHAENKVSYKAGLEHSRQSSNSKRSAYPVSSRPCQGVRCHHNNHPAGGERGTVKRTKQLTLC